MKNNITVHPIQDCANTQCYGMTLLDHFAGIAMGILMLESEFEQDQMACDAYRLAQAMLKEREKHIPINALTAPNFF